MMGVGGAFSSHRPRNNRPLKRGDSVGRKGKKHKQSPVRRVVVGSLLACLIVVIVIGGRSMVESVN
ncbi:MAG: hypothetical protein ACERKU_02005, partial [Nitrospirota bacterium]